VKRPECGDLTPQEQTNVRTALKFLRTKLGTWGLVAKVLRFGESTMGNVAQGRRHASPTLAFRVARFAKVPVDDVLMGKFPSPGTCPHCGQVRIPEPSVQAHAV
jgi:hypothetical protein